MNPKPQAAPAALLFTSPECPHCPSMQRALSTLLNEGEISALDVLDASVATERAQNLGIKSVPWLQLGPFQFEGMLSLGELRGWAERAARADGVKIYFYEMLKSGKRAKVEHMIRQQPDRAAILGDLLLDSEASMAVRIGIGAVLEELQGSDLLDALVPKLVQILQQQAPRNRADAAHYLSLIANPAALDALRHCLHDSDAEVREIAQETLAF
jgi:HEAT repeats